MSSNMIKLADFARENGVTDRAIQKHIKKHEDELNNHIDRLGNNGTWLDEYAQHYIRGLLLLKPAAVIQDNEEYRELEYEVQDLRQRLNAARDLLDVERAKNDGFMKAIAEAEVKSKLLEASESEKEQYKKEAERCNREAEAAQREAEKARMESEKAKQEIDSASAAAQYAAAEVERLKGRSFWERLRNK